MTHDFYSSINRTMVERMKDPRCLIDADALASHVSIESVTASDKDVTKKKKKKGETSTSSKPNENSSATGMK